MLWLSAALPVAAEPTPGSADKLYERTIQLIGQRRLTEAVPVGEAAVAAAEQEYGPEGVRLAAIVGLLAALYVDLGKYDLAEPLAQRGVKILQVKKPDSMELAAFLRQLAIIYGYRGKFDDMEPLHQQALTIMEHRLGPTHPDVGLALQNYALLLKKLGKNEAAEIAMQRAAAIATTQTQEDADSEGLPMKLQQVQNLRRAGHVEDAITLAQQALSSIRKSSNPALPMHPDTIGLISELASLYEGQERYGEAEAFLQSEFELREMLYGKDHPVVATILEFLAVVYEMQQHYTDAEALHKRALTIMETAGPNPAGVKMVLENYAAMLRKAGRNEEAHAIAARATEIP